MREGPPGAGPGEAWLGGPSVQGATLSLSLEARQFPFLHQLPSIVWFVASARLRVGKEGIPPTACTLQAPLPEENHTALEKVTRGRRKDLRCHLPAVGTSHSPTGAFPSCQSPSTVLSQQAAFQTQGAHSPSTPLPVPFLLPGAPFAPLRSPRSSSTLHSPRKAFLLHTRVSPAVTGARSHGEKRARAWELECKRVLEKQTLLSTKNKIERVGYSLDPRHCSQ